MKKSEPKMILNVSIDNNELEEKVKIAMDNYMEQLVLAKLDNTIAKFVDRRIDRLLRGKSWDNDNKIQGVSFEQFVRQRCENTIVDVIEKSAKEILAKKLAQLI